MSPGLRRHLDDAEVISDSICQLNHLGESFPLLKDRICGGIVNHSYFVQFLFMGEDEHDETTMLRMRTNPFEQLQAIKLGHVQIQKQAIGIGIGLPVREYTRTFKVTLGVPAIPHRLEACWPIGFSKRISKQNDFVLAIIGQKDGVHARQKCRTPARLRNANPLFSHIDWKITAPPSQANPAGVWNGHRIIFPR